MSELDLFTVSDGGILRQLPGGVVILRRKKHEWRDELDGMEKEKLLARTGKKWGSKFFKAWTLPRLTQWMAAQILAAGWHRQQQPFAPRDVRVEEGVGLAEGWPVHTIRIVCDGHYAHAYPIKD